jgi:hypothetical protein
MPTIARTGLPHGRVSSDLACPGGRAWKEGIGRTVGRLPPLDGPTLPDSFRIPGPSSEPTHDAGLSNASHESRDGAAGRVSSRRSRPAHMAA